MADDSNNKRTGWWLPIAIIATGLLLWGGLFALGAYLELGSERPDRDASRGWLKGLIILGCSLAFLAFWGVALWNRSRRLRGARSVGQPFQADTTRQADIGD